MLQNCFNLMSCNTRKPFKKIVDRRTIFNIIEKGTYGHTSTLEYPGTADRVRVSFYFGTIIPVTIHRI